jgi:hypothetical protein
MSGPKKVSSPIRIDPELEAKIEEAARLTGLSKADVMRLAMRIGFEDLRKINWNIPGVVAAAANPEAEDTRKPVKYPALRPMKPARVAEDEGNSNASA